MAGYRRSSCSSASLLLSALLAAATAAQPESPRTGLKELRDTLAKTRGAIPREVGERAQREVRRWDLSPDDLDPAARGWLREAQVYAALAVGDAQQAAAILPRLAADFPDTRQTLRLSWLVAGAAGDAELALKTLVRLKEIGAAGDAAIAKHQKRLARIGHPAPQQSVQTEAGASIALVQRSGVVLVLDFWTLREEPSAKHIAALRGLVEEYAGNGQVAFVGINSDSSQQVAAARTFAKTHGFTWPQHYERSPGRRPLTDQAFFGVAGFPWDVLIDAEGMVRAVGTARAAGFQYALRAAVAEAQGKYAPLRPRAADGIEAPRPAVQAAPAKTPKEKRGTRPAEPPHHPEARRLLDQARLYLKTGRKRDARKLLEELIDKYPNTWEAREARRMGLI